MKMVVVALSIFGTFCPTIVAQSAEQVFKDRHRVLAGWLALTKAAEFKYKSKYGRYGELADLRKAHLLETFIFESESSPKTHREAESNIVPRSTLFQVTLSGDGRHFKIAIQEEVFSGSSVSVFGDETSSGGMRRVPDLPAPIEDVPDHPIVVLPAMLPR